MEKRCIFCMEETVNEQGVCASCGRSRWEYSLSRGHLAPYTKLQNKYLLGAALGSGDRGVTYIGFDTILLHKVAVRESFPGGQTEPLLLSASPGTPGVCSVIDCFEENGTSYIVEEYLPGQTLSQYLFEQPDRKISWDRCRELFSPVLTGLCHLHSLGVVHCDISSDDLKFDGEGRLKLIGFRAAANTDSGEVGPWTDICSVCSLMYLALTGEKPASRPTHIGRPRPLAISPYAAVPQEVESAILQGMEPEIGRRYFYAGTLMERLGMDTQEAKLLAGRFRDKWGDAWLEIFTRGNFSSEKKGAFARVRRWFTKDRRRRLLIGAAGTAGVCLAFGLALCVYVKTHPVQILQLRSQWEQRQTAQARVRAAEQGFPTIDPGTEQYEKLTEELLSDYDSAEEGEGVFYSVPVSFVRREKIPYVNLYGFPLSISLAEQVIRHYLDPSLALNGSTESCRITVEPGCALDVYGIAERHYTYRLKNEADAAIRISYDPLTDRTREIRIEGHPEELTIFLRDVFPYFVPETYLTGGEIDELFARLKENVKQASDAASNIYIHNHVLFSMDMSCDVYSSDPDGLITINLTAGSHD